MADHADRDHAQWSASATERNWNCPGALALTDGLPEETSEAADWGTACHQLAEKCLRGAGPADRYIGTTEKGKKFSFEVDEEMAETAQIYVDYVTAQIDADPANTLHVEQAFSLASLNPPFDAGGTADAVLYYPTQKMIEVVDLKTGRGVVVAVKGNPQLRTYALGALLANPGLDVAQVRSTIVQPRAPHRDGRTRSETYHIADLVEWTADLLAAMQRSHEAVMAKREQDLAVPNPGYVTSPAAWADTYLRPGPHCEKTFCKARATCPALEKKALDAAGIWFDELDMPRLSNDPNPDDPAKLSRDLDMLDLIEDWCKARREHAHRLAESGVAIPDYILVPKQGREKWNEGADDKVLAAAKAAGLAPAKYLNPAKLRTPKQVRKELGAKAGLVDGLSSTPDAGTNLVRADTTVRQAAKPAVQKHFTAID